MRKLSLLSLTALASVMMAGAPAITSQASVYSLRMPSGISGNGGSCDSTQSCPTGQNGGNSQNCVTGQNVSSVLGNMNSRNNQNCNTPQNCNTSQDCNTSQGSGAVLPDMGGGQVQFFKGEIITQSLPTGTETKPEQPGTGGNRPEQPGTGENRPEQPGTGGNRPEQPGTGGNKPEQPGTGEVKPEQPETPDADSFAEEVLALVNEERAKAGAAALTLDTRAQAAAEVRAEEVKSSFSHTRPGGSNFSSALTEAGIRYTSSGENIAYGQSSAEEVMNGWMNSAGHRANILNRDFTSIGIGHSQTAGGVDYWTQLFFR